MVDLSACDRPEFVRFDILAFVDKVAFTVKVPAPGPCAALGGAGSLVALDTGFAATSFESLDMSSFSLTLWVDDVETDSVRVTPVLEGQTWQNMPAAPNTPMRRAEDFSWRVLQNHVQGCALLVL